jgi:hypothetical protein
VCVWRDSPRQRRAFASASASGVESLSVFKKLQEQVPREQAKIKALKEKHAETVIGSCTVDQVCALRSRPRC